MVTAGIRNNKIHGANKKKGDKSANPLSIILNSPLKTQRNSPFTTKKVPITKYPIGDAKKALISFLKIANINNSISFF
jgi:hypothetical protein